jgi:hypothetical protein
MGKRQPRTKQPELSWVDLIPKVEPLVYRAHAGKALGTAFIISVTGPVDGGRHTMFVTAWHVVKDVVRTNEPLDLVRRDRTLLSTLTAGPIVVYPVGPPECDTALICASTREPLIDRPALPPMPLETMLPRGAEIGWLGFPGLAYPELCFFQGVVSGYNEQPPIYLIDGVAINGVSGGPAFDRTGLLTSFVSAYVPNRVSPQSTLPGLMILTPLNLVRLWMQEILGATVTMREQRAS